MRQEFGFSSNLCKCAGCFTRRVLPRKFVPVLLAFLIEIHLLADGGAVLLSKEAGPFTITLFGSPNPLRAGKADLSVLVQRQKDKSNVLDAGTMVRLRKREGGNIVEVAAPATRK